MFGKYLKLDGEALGHIDFLGKIEEKRGMDAWKRKRKVGSPTF
jgi:phage tail tube protein FII